MKLKQNKENRNQPNKVSTAVILLWITIAIGVITSFMGFSNSLQIATASGFGSGFVIFVQTFTLVILAFFIYMIGKGKNWARITFLVLFIIGVPFSIIPLSSSLLANPILGILEIGQTILQTIALIFLFQKPSSEWFRLMKTK